jgi:uncharacterized membrane protein
MWFLGAIAGALVGAMLDDIEGFFLGGLLGAICGWILGQTRGGSLQALERRVAALEEQLAALSPQAEPAPPPEPAPEPVQIPVEPVRAAEPPRTMEPPRPIEPPRPAEPSALAALWERLFSGNLVAKAGVVVLFFGVAFLLRYAYERVHVPIELRLTGIAAGAIALLVVGWRLRRSRPGYALALQGGAVGVLYLVVFAAFRMFHLLPGPLAFALLVVMAASSAALAVAQNSLSLAALGVSGGFLAPVLASTGQGSHVALFSYYAVLNAGIVGIAWVKAWRVLNLLGFAFTFAIGALWGANAYRPELFATTEPFLVLFFAMYVVIPLLFARRRALELRDYVDGTLVFGVPLVAFGLQTALMRDIEYGAAYSAFGLALFYFLLASALWRRTVAGMRLLVESFTALSLAFGTLAIPLAFTGRLTSAAWALEGAAVAWIAVRQGRLLARCFGYLLQFAAGIAFLADVDASHGATPIANSLYLGSALLAIAGFFCAGYVNRNRERLHPGEAVLSYVLLGWAALWWFGGGTAEIMRQLRSPHDTQAVLIFFSASALAASVVSGWARWPALRWLWLAVYPAALAQLFIGVADRVHPFAALGAAAWSAAIFAHLWLISRRGGDLPALAQWLHAGGVWLLAVLAAREVAWWIDLAVQGQRVWPSIAWALAPALLLALLSARRAEARWPLSAHAQSYVVRGGAPLAVFLALWTFQANLTNNGDPFPLVYVPLLNPLDLAMAGAFLVLAAWLRAAARHGLAAWLEAARPYVFALFGAGLFVWMNGILIRSLHHWADLPFSLPAMLSSRLVQASFSLLWMLLAMAAMVVATRRALRPLWIAGAALMGIVVGKLFLVDLSGIGTVERIVSFIGAGLLMLLIGYLSPVPPRAEARAS